MLETRWHHLRDSVYTEQLLASLEMGYVNALRGEVPGFEGLSLVQDTRLDCSHVCGRGLLSTSMSARVRTHTQRTLF